MNDNAKIIGNRINTLLAQQEKKQKDLAQFLGVKDNMVSYWAGGSRVPTTEQIIRIAQFFDVSTDYLLGLSDVQNTDKDVKFICEYTGLEENAVDVLHNYKKFGLETVTNAVNWLIKTEMSTIYYQIGRAPINLEKYQRLEILSEIGNYLQYLPNDNEEDNNLNITESGKMLNDNELFNATNLDDMFTIACVRKDEIINKVLLDNIVSALKELKKDISQQGGE